MNRTTRLLVVLAVATVTALLASGGVYLAITRRPAVTVEVPAAYVVVAATPLDIGVSLTAEHVKLVAWPARGQVAGSFSKVEEVVNRGLIAAVAENEPITAAKLAPLEAGAGLSPAIRQGMRALSVRVNEVIGVAGFVVPGTRVDVLVTIQQGEESISRTVVSNAQVLTAGTRFDEAEIKKEGKPIPSTVVTLMVTPADAERIALAQTEGQIMLALRNPLDTEQTQTLGVRTAALINAGAPAPAPPPRPVRRVATVAALSPAPPPPPAPRAVETIKGGVRAVQVMP
jgi:pilus assembly protein CpaB